MVIVGVVGIVVIGLAGILWVLGGPGRQPSAATAAIRVYQCPQGLNLVDEIPAGTQVGITARSDDGAWLQFYHRVGDLDLAWAERAALAPGMDITPLPVADCAVASASGTPAATIVVDAGVSPGMSVPPGAAPTPGGAPTTGVGPLTAPPATAPATTPSASSANLPSPTPTPTPTPTRTFTIFNTFSYTFAPSPTPSLPTFVLSFPPTVTPTPLDVAGPTVTLLTYSASTIYTPEACDPNSVDIRARAVDPSGVSSVALWYQPPGSSFWSVKAMSIPPGEKDWKATITAATSWAAGDLQFYVIARDTLGNATMYPAKGAALPSVHVVRFCLKL